jgi:hypothetical protein
MKIIIMCKTYENNKCLLLFQELDFKLNIQSVIEMRDQILTTSYWLHVEPGKNI